MAMPDGEYGIDWGIDRRYLESLPPIWNAYLNNWNFESNSWSIDFEDSLDTWIQMAFDGDVWQEDNGFSGRCFGLESWDPNKWFQGIFQDVKSIGVHYGLVGAVRVIRGRARVVVKGWKLDVAGHIIEPATTLFHKELGVTGENWESVFIDIGFQSEYAGFTVQLMVSPGGKAYFDEMEFGPLLITEHPYLVFGTPQVPECMGGRFVLTASALNTKLASLEFKTEYWVDGVLIGMSAGTAPAATVDPGEYSGMGIIIPSWPYDRAVTIQAKLYDMTRGELVDEKTIQVPTTMNKTTCLDFSHSVINPTTTPHFVRTRIYVDGEEWMWIPIIYQNINPGETVTKAGGWRACPFPIGEHVAEVRMYEWNYAVGGFDLIGSKTIDFTTQ